MKLNLLNVLKKVYKRYSRDSHISEENVFDILSDFTRCYEQQEIRLTYIINGISDQEELSIPLELPPGKEENISPEAEADDVRFSEDKNIDDKETDDDSDERQS